MDKLIKELYEDKNNGRELLFKKRFPYVVSIMKMLYIIGLLGMLTKEQLQNNTIYSIWKFSLMT